jgi:peroxiredoxin
MLIKGEFNKVLSIGDAAPQFEALQGTDGKKYSLKDFKDKKCLVLIFTCNSCPVANAYEDRIAALSKKYAEAKDSQVAILAINSNTIPDDRLDKMAERAKKKKYTYAYVFDSTQEVAKSYGAMYTPEFFVLNADRKVAYLGAMDDKNKPEDVKEEFLSKTIDSLLAGKKADVKETVARGCKIRFNMK